MWPPTGLAIAALALWGIRFWPAVLVGAFLANATTSIPLPAALAIGVGNTLEAMIAAQLLRRARARVSFDEIGAVRSLVGVAAPAGAFASATIGVATLWVAGVITRSGVPSAFGLWWAGDYLGALVIAPVLVAFSDAARPLLDRAALVALSVWVAAAILATALVFGNFIPSTFLQPAQYAFLLFPFVIGAALRFGPRGASVLTLTVAFLAVVYTVRGGGPFAMQTVPSTDVSLMIYIAVLAGTGLFLSPTVARRLKAESLLREAHGHLQAVINSSPLAIYTMDAEGDVRSWNPAAETLYGWRSDEVIGGPLTLITRDLQDQRNLRERVFSGETLRGIETTAHRKDGAAVTLSLAAAPVHDAAGRVTGVLFIAADLTEVRRLEIQYRQAQKMEAVGRLAGGIAHDFNNLLTAILGTTGLLLDSLDASSPARLDVEEIEKAAKRAAGLTRQLLVFSRKQVLEPRILDLNAVVGDLHGMLVRLIGEDIKLQTRLAPELGTVQADPGQLQQAIVNLVVNSRDAMPKGGLLTIETANVELDPRELEPHTLTRPGSYVLLAVHDTGVGMDATTKARLFEPFFTTKDPGKGTGLGLATVYSIVKQSGGYIWAYSELGHGTTFKIYLPRAEGAAERIAERAAAAVAGGSETVLVVEDQPEVRALTIRILEGRGYTALAAANAAEAQEIAGRYPRPIDLLLTDVVMPGINGRELARLMAAQRTGIKVLFVSGYTGEAVREHGLLERDAAFLQKPFTPDVLAERLRALLDGRAV